MRDANCRKLFSPVHERCLDLVRSAPLGNAREEKESPLQEMYTSGSKWQWYLSAADVFLQQNISIQVTFRESLKTPSNSHRCRGPNKCSSTQENFLHRLPTFGCTKIKNQSRRHASQVFLASHGSRGLVCATSQTKLSTLHRPAVHALRFSADRFRTKTANVDR